MSHSKGPWVFDDCVNGIEGALAIVDANANVITCLGDMESCDYSDIANARLIAAAPEMLAVLEDIRGFLKSKGYDTTLVRQITKKAKGE